MKSLMIYLTVRNSLCLSQPKLLVVASNKACMNDYVYFSTRPTWHVLSTGKASDVHYVLSNVFIVQDNLDIQYDLGND